MLATEQMLMMLPFEGAGAGRGSPRMVKAGGALGAGVGVLRSM